MDSRTPVYRLKGHERDGEDEGNEQNNNDDDQKTAQKSNKNHKNTKPRIRKIKSVSLMLPGEFEPSVYVVSADNKGRICIWNIQDCLSCIIEANRGRGSNQQKEES